MNEWNHLVCRCLDIKQSQRNIFAFLHVFGHVLVCCPLQGLCAVSSQSWCPGRTQIPGRTRSKRLTAEPSQGATGHRSVAVPKNLNINRCYHRAVAQNSWRAGSQWVSCLFPVSCSKTTLYDFFSFCSFCMTWHCILKVQSYTVQYFTIYPWCFVAQVLIFPEGTCTNRSCLITFKQGKIQNGILIKCYVSRSQTRKKDEKRYKRTTVNWQFHILHKAFLPFSFNLIHLAERHTAETTLDTTLIHSLSPPGLSLEGVMLLVMCVCSQLILHTTGPFCPRMWLFAWSPLLVAMNHNLYSFYKQFLFYWEVDIILLLTIGSTSAPFSVSANTDTGQPAKGISGMLQGWKQGKWGD